MKSCTFSHIDYTVPGQAFLARKKKKEKKRKVNLLLKLNVTINCGIDFSSDGPTHSSFSLCLTQ